MKKDNILSFFTWPIALIGVFTTIFILAKLEDLILAAQYFMLTLFFVGVLVGLSDLIDK